MPYCRFEQLETKLLTPHPPTGAARFIAGRYVYRAHMPRGSRWALAAAGAFTRFAAMRSTAWLQHRIDTMTPEEQACARVERKAN
jgi:hypothetical protein